MDVAFSVAVALVSTKLDILVKVLFINEPQISTYRSPSNFWSVIPDLNVRVYFPFTDV